MNSVLLTVDLTTAVADEAIERNDAIVIAYRALLDKTKWFADLTRGEA